MISAEKLFYALLAVLPFLAVSPWQTIVYPPLYYGFIYFVLMAVVFGLLIFESMTGKRKLRFNFIFVLLSLFFVIYGLSLALNWKSIILDPNIIGLSGLMKPKVYNLFAYLYLLLNLLSVWLTCQIIDNVEKLKKAILIVAVSGALASFYGVATILAFMFGLIKTLVFAPHVVPRLYGTATEPQVFADLLIFIIPLSLAVLAERKGISSWLMVFISMLALVMTFSMGGWAGFAIAALLFLIFGARTIPAGFYLKGLSIVLMIVLSIFMIKTFLCPDYLFAFKSFSSKYMIWNLPKELKDYRESDPSKGKGVYNGGYAEKVDDKITRFFMAQTAVNMIKSHPMIGIGIGNYGFLYNQYRSPDSPIKNFYEKPHNIYYEVMAESGIFNFAVFMIAIAAALFRAARSTFKRPDLYKLAVISGFIGLLIHGFSFGVLAHNQMFFALGLLISIGEE